jgi:hypothetical protein
MMQPSRAPPATILPPGSNQTRTPTLCDTEKFTVDRCCRGLWLRHAGFLQPWLHVKVSRLSRCCLGKKAKQIIEIIEKFQMARQIDRLDSTSLYTHGRRRVHVNIYVSNLSIVSIS